MPFGNGLSSVEFRVAFESVVQMAGALMVKPVPGRPYTVALDSV